MQTPSVTIGFTARERFHLAAKSIEAIFKHTHIPFDLIVVDCNTPRKYLDEIREVLKDKKNASIIHTDTYLRGNQAKNLVLDSAKGEYTALIENDCFVSDGWLEKLINACENTGAGAAIPLLLEDVSVLNPHKVHHDSKLAIIKPELHDRVTSYKFVEDLGVMDRYKESSIHDVCSLEMHVMVVRKSVFEKIGRFDESVLADSTYAYVDLSLALFSHNIRIVCEPSSIVNFRNPPPVYADELPFYKFIWQIDNVIPSKKYLEDKWNILNMHDSRDFVSDQLQRTTYPSWYLRKVPKKIYRSLRSFLMK